jgi:HNH endonuclease/Methylase-associated X1
MSRRDLLLRVTDFMGSAAHVIEPDEGWPGFVDVETDDRVHQLALCVSSVGSMAREPDELPFQNPGQGRPIQASDGRRPLLVGVWEREQSAVIVAPETERRIGRETRFSVLFPSALVEDAASNGWATPYVSTTGEEIHAFHPALTPTFLAKAADELELLPEAIATAAKGAGLPSGEEGAAERARRVTSALVRDARFRLSVLEAYRRRCAMCGLGLGLVVGAHILPASVPGALDEAGNGFALCENHHRAFDAHLIYVNPETLEISLHPTVLALMDETEICLGLRAYDLRESSVVGSRRQSTST